MPKFKILYSDPQGEDVSIEREVLSKIDAELIIGSGNDEQALIQEGEDCDGILLVYSEINERVLDAWGKKGRMKVVSKQGIGYNNIDTKAATRNGIMVANVPDYCLEEVADHTMALALALIRELKSYDERTKGGEWSETPVRPIHRLSQLTFGLFGVGNIGKNVVKRAKAFGFPIIAFDPFLSNSEFEEMEIRKVDTLEALAEQADILSIHAPLTNDTKYAIDLPMMRHMKKSSILINTSRGAIIKQTDLEQAIEENIISGAGLDVLENEPPDMKSPLFSKNNVIITSHVGFYSEESDYDLRKRFTENVALALTQGAPRYFVNRAELEEMRRNK